MRINAFLHESPMFAVSRAARRFEAISAEALAADRLSFLEGLVLAAIFFEAPQPVKPSLLAETFTTTRGNVSHWISALEGKGLVQRRIDPNDARAYHLTLNAQGRRCALRVIAAFDKLQSAFEQEVGKSALRDTLRNVRKMEALFSA